MQHFTPYNESFPFKTLMHFLPQIPMVLGFYWLVWVAYLEFVNVLAPFKQLPDELAIAALNFPLSHP